MTNSSDQPEDQYDSMTNFFQRAEEHYTVELISEAMEVLMERYTGEDTPEDLEVLACVEHLKNHFFQEVKLSS